MLLNKKNEITLKLPAGSATNDAKLAKILGPLKVNIAKFISSFNESTTDKPGFKKGDIVVVGLMTNPDKTFVINIYGIDVSKALLKLANTNKGVATPGHAVSLSVTNDQIRSLAEDKMHYIKHFDIASLEKSIIGTAKSCGIQVK